MSIKEAQELIEGDRITVWTLSEKRVIKGVFVKFNISSGNIYYLEHGEKKCAYLLGVKKVV